MRIALGAASLLCLVACNSTDVARRAAVVPFNVQVSPDRKTVTVATHYASSIKCAQDAGGASLLLNGQRATVTAFVTNATGRDYCLLPCGVVVQTITLDNPLPAGVSFVAPASADPGVCSHE